MRRHLVSAALIVAASISASRSVSAQKYQICDVASGLLCMGYEFATPSGTNPLKVNVWDASAPGTNGRIVSFGFWNLGGLLTLSNVRYFDGTTLSGPIASMGDWTNGPNSGYGISGQSASAGLANNDGDGFTLDPKPANTSCNTAATGGGAYNIDCWLTGGTAPNFKYLQFEFSGANAFTSSAVGAGFRAQNTGSSGSGSFKCGIGGGEDVEGLCGPSGTVTVLVTATPEPSTYMLMGAGLAALGFFARKRRQRNA